MEELSKSQQRDAPPMHFRLKIESFSTLSASWPERYESSAFNAGDYTWKLALYPNGNTLKNSEDHISFYLVLADNSKDKLKKEILVSFTLLLFDNIRKIYFSVQKVCSFDAEKSEQGFDKFLTLKSFIDPSNGYIVNDFCMFGADIFVMKDIPKGQCLSMMPSKPAPYKHAWKIDNFSGLKNREYSSEKFTTRGHHWRLSVYPKGNGGGKDNSLSLFLDLADSGTAITEGSQVLVEYTLRVVDQLNKKHKETRDSNCFSASMRSWGTQTFLSFRDLKEPSLGYLVDDSCVVEAEVIVLGSANGWDELP